MAYLDIKNRMGDPSEASIGNYDVWLNWWAHQLNTPQWWGELVALLVVEDLKRLAQKIWASFLIPAVRCEAFLNWEHTMHPAAKCLTRSRFLPDDPTYQDIWL